MAIVFLFTAASIMFLGFRGPVWFPTWSIAARRRWLGGALLLAGLVLWLVTAVLLVHEQRNWTLINALAPIFIFAGIAFFLPPPTHGDNPPPESEPLKLLHGIPGRVIIGLGIALGLLNAFLMITSRDWVITLARFYYALGLHGNLQ